jgi:DNA-binding MarR family transcriptional regulator
MDDSVVTGRARKRPSAKRTAGADRLLFALMHVARGLEHQLEEALESVGLSIAKHGVLAQLAAAREPLTLSELADRNSCVRSNITQLVDRLETEGLVRRIDDATDRRMIRAVLTPAGIERQAAGAEQVRAAEAAFVASMGPTDRAALTRVLARLK